LREGIRRFARRTDTRASLLIGFLLLTSIAIESAVLYAFVAMESLEAADAWVQHILRTVEREVAIGVDPSLAVADARLALEGSEVAMRVEASDGSIERFGRWPDESVITRAQPGDDGRDLNAFRVLDPSGFLVGSRRFDQGEKLEVAVSMEHFASELAEIKRGLLLVAGITSALALVSAVFATTWAFRPLRQSSRALERVGPRRLAERIPERGTRDPVDEHARLLNETLEEIDGSFSRLREFASVLAHEFRTPLNRIATVAEVAYDGTLQQKTKALESVRATSAELSRVVDGLLLIAEVEDGRATTRFQPFDLTARLENAIAVYEAAFEARGSSLRVDTCAAVIRGDPDLIDRVIANLLDNALHHTDPNTAVAVRCQWIHEGVQITVDDAGAGIPQEDSERVFERFVTVGDGRPNGHGLGLAIARSIAVSHGGDLRVEASKMGGARFVLWLPGRKPPEVATEPRPIDVSTLSS